jgi:hypothetical protein
MADSLFQRNFIIGDDLNSYEDVHQLIEERLQGVPTMIAGGRSIHHFEEGWWAGRAGYTSCDQWFSLFQQFIICFIGDDVLLPDASLRRRFTKLLQRFFSVLKRVRGRTWWRSTLSVSTEKNSAAKLEKDMIALVSDFAWLQSLLESPLPPLSERSSASVGVGDKDRSKGNCPGDGLDIPKLSDFLNLASQAIELGCAAGSSTSPFERRNKAVHDADNSTSRHQREDHGATLFTRVTRNEATDALIHEGLHFGVRKSTCISEDDSDSDDDDDDSHDAAAASATRAARPAKCRPHIVCL